MVSNSLFIKMLLNNFYILLTIVSIITFCLVMLMLYSEFNYFLFPGYKFRFAPDADFGAKLKLNVDMTVAMPCDCKILGSLDLLGLMCVLQ